MNKISKSFKDYFGKLWPVIISICCSIIFTIVFTLIVRKALSPVFILLSFAPIIVGFIVHCVFLYNDNFYDEKKNHQMLVNLNNIRRLAHKFPDGNQDLSRFKQAITQICDYVCQTIIGVENEVKNCSEFCVVVFFVYGNEQDEGSYHLIQIAHDNSIMGNEYYSILEENKLLGNSCIGLKDNSSYYTIFKAYIKDQTHLPKIVTKENIRKKAKKGKFQSTFVNLPAFGYSKIPYNSSCVLPILPFHNTNKNGNEMQGYMAIMSTRKKAFKDKGIKNKDFESYLESVSGLLYKVCTKDKSKDQ